jgi:hypothetical protein
MQMENAHRAYILYLSARKNMTTLNINRWIGTQANGNWYDASNWSLGRVPDTTDLASVEVNTRDLNLSFLRNGVNQNPSVGGISLKMIGVGTLTLSGLTEYSVSTMEDTVIEASNGGKINLANLQRISGANNIFSLNVSAKSRGDINLDNLTQINGGTVEFLSDGLGSVIRLSKLETFVDTGFDRSLLKVRNAGTIAAGKIRELNEVDLVSDNSFLALPSLVTYRGDNTAEAINGGQLQIDAIKTVQGRILQARATGGNSRVLISNELRLNVDYLEDERNGGLVIVEGAGTINYPPLVNQGIPQQNATEDQTFTYTFPSDTFVEIDSTVPLTYTAALTNGSALPSWLNFNSNTRTFSGTPGNDQVGIVDVRVRATDSAGAAATTDLRIVVANVNDAPTVANPLPDQQAASSQTFSYTVPANTFNDIDLGDTLTYSTTLENGQALPSWLSFNAGNRTFSGTPPRSAIGTLNITVRATDRAGLFVNDTFSLAIVDSNRAPVVSNPVADQSIPEDEEFNFTLPANTFTDPNVGDTLTYSVSGLPGWLTFAPATTTFTGTPGNSDVGASNITVTVRDPFSASASDSFRLTVINVNDAPTVASSFAPQTLREDVPYIFSIPNNHFVDIDAGDSLTSSIINLPAWLDYNPLNATFSGTPDNSNVGNYEIIIRATDTAGASVEDTLALTVINVNDAPRVTRPINDQTNTLNLPYRYQIPSNTITDIDEGDTLTYTVANLPNWLSFNAQTLTLEGTPTEANLGTFSLEVIATDSSSASAQEDFFLTIYPTFDPLQYLASYPDLIRAYELNPNAATFHYENFGRFEGRVPDTFDEYRYLASYRDLLLGYGTDDVFGVTTHFIEHGLEEGRNPNSFDALRYIAGYEDLIKAFGADTLAGSRHYVKAGVLEGRNPQLFPDTQYIASYPDLIQAFGYDGQAGSFHYVSAGFAEGRRFDIFKPDIYIASDPQRIENFGYNLEAGTRDFIEVGFFSGVGQGDFDPIAYRDLNPDLIVFGDDTVGLTRHYIEHGLAEGRVWR